MYAFLSAAPVIASNTSLSASASASVSSLRATTFTVSTNRSVSQPQLSQSSSCTTTMIAEMVESGGKHISDKALERARSGNKFEKIKLAKDGSTMWTEIHELSKLLREGKTSWEDLAVDDIDVRLKWTGLFHRRKTTPGKFMMRLKVPNGILNSEQLRYFSTAIKPYGEDGCGDITTRMNIQLRGITLDDASDICDNFYKIGLTSFMSGMDNVRNMVGSPIAGIDPNELIDTRPFCKDINDMITDDRRGRPELANLPRKFNICVSGSRDDFAHTHINDVGLVPVPHDVTGEIGFNVVIGGLFSIKRNEEAIPMNVWLKPDQAVKFCEVVLIWFRDNGDRGNRQASRLMYMVDQLTMPGFRTAIEQAFGSPFENAQTGGLSYQTPVPRRNVLGVHKQKQPGLSWVGACVPAGRFIAEDFEMMADIADKYSNGEVRLTVEQNIIFPNVSDDEIDNILKEPLLMNKFKVRPGTFAANLVSCTGSQFCGIALIETKNRAMELTKRLDEALEVTRDVRIHMTGCPNSCGQAQVADIGLMGAVARKDGKGVQGVKIFLGGKIGEDGHLAEQIAGKPVPADVDDLFPVIKEILIEQFGATPRS